MKTPCNASSTIRKLFKLRPLAQSWIKYETGNGHNTFLWTDYWHPLGSLYQKYGDGIVCHMGKSLTAKVATIISNGGWKWPRSRNPAVQDIIAHTPPNFQPHVDCEDSVPFNC
ncbi:hypothetical protein Vadar_026684 [Vaccinium darrowii]|uniref:Uncharacterized protein n=1 Tax=Vaccinium darrowii TaxID=229202 RepID=A0ACB7XUK5_9ERIC|nr:hypothetical protein Vadar_026684 [Vaccinium darrowii]